MDADRLHIDLYIVRLIKKSLFEELSELEKNELDGWINKNEENRLLFQRIQDGTSIGEDLLFLEQYDTEPAIRKILLQTDLVYKEQAPKTGFLGIRQMKFWRVAAAAVLLFTISGITWFTLGKPGHQPGEETLVNAKVVPGGNKAILKLSDGSEVILDSATNGLISSEGNSKVVKLDNGHLAYNATTNGSQEAPVFNTLSTPRGGQYQLTLSDGTVVWLNSASSITFPTFFTGDERFVKISGEAYFEVKSITTATGKFPFVVEAESERITVLGTHFNINAYTDEETVRTTLVEGTVKVSNANGSILIKPGEQAMKLKGASTYNVIRPDMEEVLAWKNGKFIFKNTSAKSIMLQLSRWYDIDIKYKNDLSGINFSGGLSRKDEIEKLVEILELDGRIKLELKGRELIVKKNN